MFTEGSNFIYALKHTAEICFSADACVSIEKN